MREKVEVVYENGVLRPLGSLSNRFQEHQRLTIMVDDCKESNGWLSDADPSVSLETVRRALGRSTKTIAQMVHDERNEH